MDPVEGPVPCAVIEPSTGAVISGNERFASLVGVSPSDVGRMTMEPLLEPNLWAQLRAVMGGMSAGVVEFAQLRGNWLMPSGAIVPTSCWVRPAERDDPLVLLAVAAVGPDAALPFGPYGPVTGDPVLIVVHDENEWRISEISLDGLTLFGLDPDVDRGRALQSVVHPDDAPVLVAGLGRSGVERRGMAMNLRVRSRSGAWASIRCEISPLCSHNPPQPRFALAMRSLAAPGAGEPPGERIARLEAHLWRISVEVASAGLREASGSDEMRRDGLPLPGFSPRQLEILTRLLRGERVPTIARELFISQSTVRNHLSAIYQRFGVHSQADLIARLRPTPPPEPVKGPAAAG